MAEASLPPQAAQRTLALYAAVAAGSALGSVARWIVSVLLEGAAAGLPWSTLFVNATGSFAIGCYASRLALRDPAPIDPVQRAFVAVGLCGGYTTFSIFSFETLALLQGGRTAAAAANVALSLTVWLLAVQAGYLLGQRRHRRHGPR